MRIVRKASQNCFLSIQQFDSAALERQLVAVSVTPTAMSRNYLVWGGGSMLAKASLIGLRGRQCGHAPRLMRSVANIIRRC